MTPFGLKKGKSFNPMDLFRQYNSMIPQKSDFGDLVAEAASKIEVFYFSNRSESD